MSFRGLARANGLRKCFADSAGPNEAELIRLVADNQEREFERLGIEFQSLWGRRLQLTDCQNLFCEVDKYARVAHPEVSGISGRTRIKQRFSPTGLLERPWYPRNGALTTRLARTRLPPWSCLVLTKHRILVRWKRV